MGRAVLSPEDRARLSTTMKISRGQLRQIIREELEERIGGTERRHLRTLREAGQSERDRLQAIAAESPDLAFGEAKRGSSLEMSKRVAKRNADRALGEESAQITHLAQSEDGRMIYVVVSKR